MPYEQATGGLVSSTHQPGEMTPLKVAQAEFTGQRDPVADGFEFLKVLTQRLELEDQVTDRLFHQKWLKVSKMYEGEHLGRFDSRGQWRSYQPQLGDPYYIHPELRFHSDAITASWTQARPDIRVLPANDSDETVAKARKANQILDHYEMTLLTEDFLQREGKLGQFTGQMWRYSYWDPNAGPKVPRYDFQPQDVNLHPGAVTCPGCGLMATPDQMGDEENCPNCGTPLDVQPPQTAQVPVPVPAGEYNIGDVCTECVPAFQIKVDRSGGTFERALWLRRRRMIRPEILKEMFPQWEPSQKMTAMAAAEDFALRSERILQQSTGQPGRAWRPDTLANPYSGVVINQWWLTPCMYASRGPEAVDLQFASGLTIPAGTRLIEIFPTGLYLLMSEGKILDIREEYIHDHWQHSPFISIPTRVEGDGIEDLLEPQRELNDLMSLVYIDAKSNAAPPTVVNTTYGLKTTDVAGKPHWVIPARVPTGENIANAILPLPNRGTPASLFRYIDMIRGESQLLAKSFSPATGAPDTVTNGASMDTATAAQLATSAAQAQRAPELAQRAAGNVVWARQVLKIFQKNAVDEHYIPLQGRYGLLEGNYFKGADIEADFIFTVRNRSWIPRDEFSRRSDLLGAIQAGLLNPQLPRAIRDEIAEVFNVGIELTTDVADTRLARMRLEQMEQLLQQQQELPPQILLAAVPLEPISDIHTVMSEWYVDWLKTDEGLSASPILRVAVTERILEHEQAEAMNMQRMAALQMATMAPQMGMQMAQQQQQQQQEAEQQKAKPKSKGSK